MSVRSALRSAAAAIKVIAAKKPNNPAAVISVNQKTNEKGEINKFDNFKDSSIFNWEIKCLITSFNFCIFLTCWRAQVNMTWPKTEAAGIILKCTGIYSLPRFSQSQWSKDDWTAHNTNGRWPKTYSKSNPGVFEVKKVDYSAMAESISWSQPDWAAFHLLKTKLKAERPTNKQ